MLDQDQNPAEALVDVTPAAPPLPAAPRSRRRLWLTVAAVLVLGAGGFGVAFADNFANLGAYAYSAPKEFDGMPLSPEYSRQKRTRLGSGSGTSDTGYVSADQDRFASVTVDERHIFLPSSEIDAVVARLGKEGFAFTDLHDVDPGDRGGVMKCGRAGFEGGEVTACAWADGSMAASLAVGVHGDTVDPETLAGRVRAFRRLAEVPS
ncbi:hypothetical protein ACFYUY_18730 [Kitasatospora sp. NPDC004745]|uniref:hypothetical protein n=1 Tax=Kitasatospora sp. NPDC004745 TaxID=3364019 RepID=UPI0036CB1190